MTSAQNCGNCGVTLSEGASFCKSCGATVRSVEDMNCPTCGNDTSADAQFCGECGASLSISTPRRIGAVSSELPMVSFPRAVKLGFSNYFSFSGRSTRAEYWWWIFFVLAWNIILTMVTTLFLVLGWRDGSPVSMPSVLFALATLIPSVASGARRLHDINRSGWWQLMWFGILLIVLAIALIVWAIKPSDEGTKQTRPSPAISCLTIAV